MKYSLFITSLILYSVNSFSQGCVAVKGFSGCAANDSTGTLKKGSFVVGGNYRYFKSFRHFRGDHQERERVEKGTEVINESSFFDLNINYGFTERLYSTVTIPYSYINRSSMYEHGGNPPNGLGYRAETSSVGIGDIRLGLGYWFIDPKKLKKYNFAFGLGIKLPTGDYNYTDTFYNQGPNKDQTIEAVVDQSIQPGDGGTGAILDFQGYYSFSKRFSLNLSTFYLLNPRETNGVYTRNSTTTMFSVPDQFAGRIGVNYSAVKNKLLIYLGSRIEGVTASDLIGGDEGFRRPGYVVSIEPGLSLDVSNYNFSLNVPIALYRNRIQSFIDKQRTSQTGVYTIGDAAFADYLISFTMQYRFGGKAKSNKKI